MERNEKSVLVAMSGGVDSSVAASLLRDEGYDVTGVFMCLGRSGDARAQSGCCSPADAADARLVAGRLGIDLHVLNLADAFAPIVDNFVAEYAAGRTPNPCIHCNARLKFGRLIELADSLGVASVATGHYARLIDVAGRFRIARGRHAPKDQSYALFAIDAGRLGRMRLPMGDWADKDAVRRRARDLGLLVHDKPDSQDICFVADDDYTTLLSERAPRALRPGRIVSVDGEVLGEHDGYGRFTIGQRRGLGIAAGEPMYVTAIDAATGDVTIGTRDQACSTRLTADRANWHAEPPGETFDAVVQIRYNHRGCPARVSLSGPQSFAVQFDRPVHAITPGQAAVIYQNDILLGGGWIT